MAVHNPLRIYGLSAAILYKQQSNIVDNLHVAHNIVEITKISRKAMYGD